MKERYGGWLMLCAGHNPKHTWKIRKHPLLRIFFFCCWSIKIFGTIFQLILMFIATLVITGFTTFVINVQPSSSSSENWSVHCNVTKSEKYGWVADIPSSALLLLPWQFKFYPAISMAFDDDHRWNSDQVSVSLTLKGIFANLRASFTFAFCGQRQTDSQTLNFASMTNPLQITLWPQISLLCFLSLLMLDGGVED